MRTTAQDVTASLEKLGADRRHTARRLAAQLRRSGVSAGASAMWDGIRAYRLAGLGRPGWARLRASLSKAEAAEILGVSVQRVDQLRASGTLDAWRDPVTCRVHLRLASVRELVRQRERDARAG